MAGIHTNKFSTKYVTDGKQLQRMRSNTTMHASAIKRAESFQTKLPLQHPSFIKVMTHPNIARDFWLDLPYDLCKKHLPSGDEKIVLVDGSGVEYTSQYLKDRTALGGGWKRFAESHRLKEGDVLVFELVRQTKFQVLVMVYIFVEHEKNFSGGSTGHGNSSSTLPVSLYTVQCCKCFKFRLISAHDEYEHIRKNMDVVPWFCSRKAHRSCDDPADIEYNAARTWIVDKPNLPRTPGGFKRVVRVAKDYSTCDVGYILPNGRKVSSLVEIQQFLRANPEYGSVVNLSDFDFTCPMIMEDTIPPSAVVKASTRIKAETKLSSRAW